MNQIDSAYKEKGLREPACRFCGKYDYSFIQLPEHSHLGLPLYHLKNQHGAHLGLMARECLECGHLEIFFEKPLRQILGLPAFVHKVSQKEKKDK